MARKSEDATQDQATLDQQKERGRRVAEWIRSGMIDPVSGERMRPADVARLLKKSPSVVGVWLNDCYDESEERYKLPGEETLQLIADKLHISFDVGLAARFFPYFESRLEITGVIDLGDLPVPEGYRDLDESGRAFVSDSLRAAVILALKAQRRDNIGRRVDEEDQQDDDEDADDRPFD